MMFWFGHMNGWGWFVMSLSTLLFWAVIIAVGVLLFQALARPKSPGGGHSSWQKTPPGSGPEQVLAERYARGEIDDEEYHRRLAVLRGSPMDAAKPSAP
ncbi:SHOCT domain-containing protein [Streptomyces spiralis]|uniref:SHOCT domain-containing protein n=1 Tax=Streptomyces spiralis TaxID=66376 RepID=UPI003408F491